MNRSRCIFCNQYDQKVIQYAENPYKVVKCKSCGLVFVAPFPEDKILVQSYSEEYYKEWISIQKVKRVKLWQKRFASVSSLLKRNGKIIDIGCGDGTFLEIAKNNGWDIHGTEFSPYASKYASDRLGINIQNKGLIDSGFKDDYFKIVTMWHVLEHLKNPLETLSEIKRVLKKDGFLIVAVPNYNNLVMKIAYRIFKGRSLPLFSMHAKEQHLFHYTPGTLVMILKKAGFKVVKLEPDISAIDTQKQIVDSMALLFYFLFNIKIFGAMKVTAVPL